MKPVHVRTLFAASSLLLAAAAGAPGQAPQAKTLVIRNNHEYRFTGPVEIAAELPDGRYQGRDARADVRSGRVYATVSLAPRGSVTLTSEGRMEGSRNLLDVRPASSSLAVQWQTRALADISLALSVIPGKSAAADDAVRAYTALPLSWVPSTDGSVRAAADRDGYHVDVTARAYGGGWLDVSANVSKQGSPGAPAYVALVRRVVTRGVKDARLRFNGREFAGAESPGIWDRDFWYVRGVDWLRWRSGDVSLVATNAFTPVPTVKHDSTWGEGSHFYVWERTRQAGDTLYLVSEIAGPNPDQAKSRYMAVSPYAALLPGDTVRLASRFSIATTPDTGWEEVQLRAFAGARLVSRSADTVRVDIGVSETTFGIAYFPYSTFIENLDYYRTAGTTSESFWPTSPVMWRQWRLFVPRMRTDLRIIRAMGFQAVRLHHLELLRALPRDEAFAFLDFFAGEARTLGLSLMMDTEGPADWVSAVVGRYRDIVTRVELENEILIGGIKPGDPARWSELYAAAKKASPSAQVFFTGAGNNAMFERLRGEGVPFDRVGLHSYKHGPQWKEAFASLTLGTGGYATSLGKAATLGEFDWKDLTKLTPEEKGTEFETIYRNVLAARAIPELIHFQFQEQAAFNTTVSGTMSRHYEPVGMDRRPKPEALVTQRMIREYGPQDAPVVQLPIEIGEVRFTKGSLSGVADFTVTNRTGRPVRVALASRSFDGTVGELLSSANISLASRVTARGRLRVSLPEGSQAGTYHHFLEATFDRVTALGWGVVSNEGAPTFADTSVLGTSRVRYAQGPASVRRFPWTAPAIVVYGVKASVIELEEAFQLGNTLQAASGQSVRVISEASLTPTERAGSNLIVVGTTASNALVESAGIETTAGIGTIAFKEFGNLRGWLILTGADSKGVEASVVELVLRYWPNARDSSMRLVGMEKGAALGNRKQGSSIDLP